MTTGKSCVKWPAGIIETDRYACWRHPLIAVIICGLAVAVQSWAQSPIPRALSRSGWESTIAAQGAHYMGDAACVTCHVAEASTERGSLMAKALRRPEDSEVLRLHPRLRFRRGRFVYEVRREGGSGVYSVSDGQRTIVVPILAAVGYGLGAVGQTFLLEYQGFFIESEVTYYDQIHGLDITPGHQNTTPAFLEGALGIRLRSRDLRQCLGCHATAAVSDKSIQLNRMIPGIGCEGCHGPGSGHIQAVKSGHLKDLGIFNPGSLRPGDLNDFCGSCHRTALAEKLLGVRGVQNVRFQGYRLARSLCYSSGDRRISCTACHDPHKPLVQQASFYDSKCLACHSSNQKSRQRRHAMICPVARQNCATCHMPKVGIPGIHYRFTDHWIRIAKAGSPYPE